MTRCHRGWRRPTAEAFAARLKATRRQIAFYGSTPAYRPVLELHGWSELADRLHALSVTKDESRWAAMGDLIDDDVLAAFAVVGRPAEAAAELKRRYGDIVDRVHVPASAGLTEEEVTALVAANVVIDGDQMPQGLATAYR